MDEYRILGVIPARGGSRGIPRKNLRMLLGKPLINARLPHTRICSTDSREIADCVSSTGIDVPWLRPAHLAMDGSRTVQVLEHALRSLRDSGLVYTHVALVQPTSPTVLAEDIDAAIRLAVDNDVDTVISGFHSTHAHPSLMYSLGENHQVEWLLPDHERQARRQELSRMFIRTGLVYVVRADLVLERRSLYGERILALEIPESRSITIDDEHDFHIA